MTQNTRPMIAELAERISRNAWNWDLSEFARRIGNDPTSAVTKHQWACFQAIAKALSGVPAGLLQVISVQQEESCQPS
jgi:hypothetical protein